MTDITTCPHTDLFLDPATGDLRCRTCVSVIAAYVEGQGHPDFSWTVECPEQRCGALAYDPCRRSDGTPRAVSCGRRWAKYDREKAHAKTRRAEFTADDIVRVIESAPVSQLQQAFRQLGWSIRLTIAEDPTPTIEEPQP